jgi:hypothetical protein
MTLARTADGVRDTYKRILSDIIGANKPGGPVLHIISEPMAAMLHCNKFVKEDESLWESTQPVLVTDIGGGTLDLTVQQWGPDHVATQLSADDGSFDAGCRVDELMEERLIERVGGRGVWDAFRDYEVNHPDDMPDLEFTYLESECRTTCGIAVMLLTSLSSAEIMGEVEIWFFRDRRCKTVFSHRFGIHDEEARHVSTIC